MIEHTGKAMIVHTGQDIQVSTYIQDIYDKTYRTGHSGKDILDRT